LNKIKKDFIAKSDLTKTLQE